MSIHDCVDLETIETIFRIIVSANQLSLYGAVAEMCEEYETLHERTGQPVVRGQSSSSFVPSDSISMNSTELPSSSKRVCDGYEEPSGTHENFDQATGEVLFAVGCRDDRPIVDSGSVVSTCPVDYATSVPTEKVQYSTNLECVG